MKNNTIILGIGNVGRQDDGLGWLFLDFLEDEDFEGIDIEYRYQLQIEDAELICNYQTVIFIDATKEITKKGYYYKYCEPSDQFGFSTHELAPETILFLANQLYNQDPKAFILGIQGHKWNLEVGLSKTAKENLDKAKEYFGTNIFSRHVLSS